MTHKDKRDKKKTEVYQEMHEPSSSQKNCNICDKSFHFRKKIICADCELSFCSEHCCKEIGTVEGLILICDMCYHNFRRKKIQENQTKDMDLLIQEQSRICDGYKREERLIFEKTSELNRLETEYSPKKEALSKKILKHEKKLKEAEDKIEVQQKILSELEIEHKSISEKYNKTNKEFIESDTKLEETSNSIQHLNNIKSELLSQLAQVEEKIDYCLDYTKIEPLICSKCREQLKKSYQDRIRSSHASIEDSSMSLYRTQSIIENVREIQESLNALIIEPEKNPKCLIS